MSKKARTKTALLWTSLGISLAAIVALLIWWVVGYGISGAQRQEARIALEGFEQVHGQFREAFEGYADEYTKYSMWQSGYDNDIFDAAETLDRRSGSYKDAVQLLDEVALFDKRQYKEPYQKMKEQFHSDSRLAEILLSSFDQFDQARIRCHRVLASHEQSTPPEREAMADSSIKACIESLEDLRDASAWEPLKTYANKNIDLLERLKKVDVGTMDIYRPYRGAAPPADVQQRLHGEVRERFSDELTAIYSLAASGDLEKELRGSAKSSNTSEMIRDFERSIE